MGIKKCQTPLKCKWFTYINSFHPQNPCYYYYLPSSELEFHSSNVSHLHS